MSTNDPPIEEFNKETKFSEINDNENNIEESIDNSNYNTEINFNTSVNILNLTSNSLIKKDEFRDMEITEDTLNQVSNALPSLVKKDFLDLEPPVFLNLPGIPEMNTFIDNRIPSIINDFRNNNDLKQGANSGSNPNNYSSNNNDNYDTNYTTNPGDNYDSKEIKPNSNSYRTDNLNNLAYKSKNSIEEEYNTLHTYNYNTTNLVNKKTNKVSKFRHKKTITSAISENEEKEKDNNSYIDISAITEVPLNQFKEWIDEVKDSTIGEKLLYAANERFIIHFTSEDGCMESKIETNGESLKQIFKLAGILKPKESKEDDKGSNDDNNSVKSTLSQQAKIDSILPYIYIIEKSNDNDDCESKINLGLNDKFNILFHPVYYRKFIVVFDKHRLHKQSVSKGSVNKIFLMMNLTNNNVFKYLDFVQYIRKFNIEYKIKLKHLFENINNSNDKDISNINNTKRIKPILIKMKSIMKIFSYITGNSDTKDFDITRNIENKGDFDDKDHKKIDVSEYITFPTLDTEYQLNNMNKRQIRKIDIHMDRIPDNSYDNKFNDFSNHKIIENLDYNEPNNESNNDFRRKMNNNNDDKKEYERNEIQRVSIKRFTYKSKASVDDLANKNIDSKKKLTFKENESLFNTRKLSNIKNNFIDTITSNTDSFDNRDTNENKLTMISVIKENINQDDNRFNFNRDNEENEDEDEIKDNYYEYNDNLDDNSKVIGKNQDSNQYYVNDNNEIINKNNEGVLKRYYSSSIANNNNNNENKDHSHEINKDNIGILNNLSGLSNEKHMNNTTTDYNLRSDRKYSTTLNRELQDQLTAVKEHISNQELTDNNPYLYSNLKSKSGLKDKKTTTNKKVNVSLYQLNKTDLNEKQTVNNLIRKFNKSNSNSIINNSGNIQNNNDNDNETNNLNTNTYDNRTYLKNFDDKKPSILIAFEQEMILSNHCIFITFSSLKKIIAYSTCFKTLTSFESINFPISITVKTREDIDMYNEEEIETIRFIVRSPISKSLIYLEDFATLTKINSFLDFKSRELLELLMSEDTYVYVGDNSINIIFHNLMVALIEQESRWYNAGKSQYLSQFGNSQYASLITNNLHNANSSLFAMKRLNSRTGISENDGSNKKSLMKSRRSFSLRSFNKGHSRQNSIGIFNKKKKIDFKEYEGKNTYGFLAKNNNDGINKSNNDDIEKNEESYKNCFRFNNIISIYTINNFLGNGKSNKENKNSNQNSNSAQTNNPDIKPFSSFIDVFEKKLIKNDNKNDNEYIQTHYTYTNLNIDEAAKSQLLNNIFKTFKVPTKTRRFNTKRQLQSQDFGNKYVTQNLNNNSGKNSPKYSELNINTNTGTTNNNISDNTSNNNLVGFTETNSKYIVKKGMLFDTDKKKENKNKDNNETNENNTNENNTIEDNDNKESNRIFNIINTKSPQKFIAISNNNEKNNLDLNNNNNNNNDDMKDNNQKNNDNKGNKDDGDNNIKQFLRFNNLENTESYIYEPINENKSNNNFLTPNDKTYNYLTKANSNQETVYQKIYNRYGKFNCRIIFDKNGNIKKNDKDNDPQTIRKVISAYSILNIIQYYKGLSEIDTFPISLLPINTNSFIGTPEITESYKIIIDNEACNEEVIKTNILNQNRTSLFKNDNNKEGITNKLNTANTANTLTASSLLQNKNKFSIISIKNHSSIYKIMDYLNLNIEEYTNQVSENNINDKDNKDNDTNQTNSQNHGNQSSIASYSYFNQQRRNKTQTNMSLNKQYDIEKINIVEYLKAEEFDKCSFNLILRMKNHIKAIQLKKEDEMLFNNMSNKNSFLNPINNRKNNNYNSDNGLHLSVLNTNNKKFSNYIIEYSGFEDYLFAISKGIKVNCYKKPYNSKLNKVIIPLTKESLFYILGLVENKTNWYIRYFDFYEEGYFSATVNRTINNAKSKNNLEISENSNNNNNNSDNNNSNHRVFRLKRYKSYNLRIKNKITSNSNNDRVIDKDDNNINNNNNNNNNNNSDNIPHNDLSILNTSNNNLNNLNNKSKNDIKRFDNDISSIKPNISPNMSNFQDSMLLETSKINIQDGNNSKNNNKDGLNSSAIVNNPNASQISIIDSKINKDNINNNNNNVNTSMSNSFYKNFIKEDVKTLDKSTSLKRSLVLETLRKKKNLSRSMTEKKKSKKDSKNKKTDNNSELIAIKEDNKDNDKAKESDDNEDFEDFGDFKTIEGGINTVKRNTNKSNNDNDNSKNQDKNNNTSVDIKNNLLEELNKEITKNDDDKEDIKNNHDNYINSNDNDKDDDKKISKCIISKVSSSSLKYTNADKNKKHDIHDQDQDQNEINHNMLKYFNQSSKSKCELVSKISKASKDYKKADTNENFDYDKYSNKIRIEEMEKNTDNKNNSENNKLLDNKNNIDSNYNNIDDNKVIFFEDKFNKINNSISNTLNNDGVNELNQLQKNIEVLANDMNKHDDDNNNIDDKSEKSELKSSNLNDNEDNKYSEEHDIKENIKTNNIHNDNIHKDNDNDNNLINDKFKDIIPTNNNNADDNNIKETTNTNANTNKDIDIKEDIGDSKYKNNSNKDSNKDINNIVNINNSNINDKNNNHTNNKDNKDDNDSEAHNNTKTIKEKNNDDSLYSLYNNNHSNNKNVDLLLIKVSKASKYYKYIDTDDNNIEIKDDVSKDMKEKNKDLVLIDKIEKASNDYNEQIINEIDLNDIKNSIAYEKYNENNKNNKDNEDNKDVVNQHKAAFVEDLFIRNINYNDSNLNNTNVAEMINITNVDYSNDLKYLKDSLNTIIESINKEYKEKKDNGIINNNDEKKDIDNDDDNNDDHINKKNRNDCKDTLNKNDENKEKVNTDNKDNNDNFDNTEYNKNNNNENNDDNKENTKMITDTNSNEDIIKDNAHNSSIKKIFVEVEFDSNVINNDNNKNNEDDIDSSNDRNKDKELKELAYDIKDKVNLYEKKKETVIFSEDAYPSLNNTTTNISLITNTNNTINYIGNNNNNSNNNNTDNNKDSNLLELKNNLNSKTQELISLKEQEFEREDKQRLIEKSNSRITITNDDYLNIVKENSPLIELLEKDNNDNNELFSINRLIKTHCYLNETENYNDFRKNKMNRDNNNVNEIVIKDSEEKANSQEISIIGKKVIDSYLVNCSKYIKKSKDRDTESNNSNYNKDANDNYLIKALKFCLIERDGELRDRKGNNRVIVLESKDNKNSNEDDFNTIFTNIKNNEYNDDDEDSNEEINRVLKNENLNYNKIIAENDNDYKSIDKKESIQDLYSDLKNRNKIVVIEREDLLVKRNKDYNDNAISNDSNGNEYDDSKDIYTSVYTAKTIIVENYSPEVDIDNKLDKGCLLRCLKFTLNKEFENLKYTANSQARDNTEIEYEDDMTMKKKNHICEDSNIVINNALYLEEKRELTESDILNLIEKEESVNVLIRSLSFSLVERFNQNNQRKIIIDGVEFNNIRKTNEQDFENKSIIKEDSLLDKSNNYNNDVNNNDNYRHFSNDLYDTHNDNDKKDDKLKDDYLITEIINTNKSIFEYNIDNENINNNNVNDKEKGCLLRSLVFELEKSKDLIKNKNNEESIIKTENYISLENNIYNVTETIMRKDHDTDNDNTREDNENTLLKKITFSLVDLKDLIFNNTDKSTTNKKAMITEEDYDNKDNDDNDKTSIYKYNNIKITESTEIISINDEKYNFTTNVILNNNNNNDNSDDKESDNNNILIKTLKFNYLDEYSKPKQKIKDDFTIKEENEDKRDINNSIKNTIGNNIVNTISKDDIKDEDKTSKIVISINDKLYEVVNNRNKDMEFIDVSYDDDKDRKDKINTNCYNDNNDNEEMNKLLQQIKFILKEKNDKSLYKDNKDSNESISEILGNNKISNTSYTFIIKKIEENEFDNSDNNNDLNESNKTNKLIRVIRFSNNNEFDDNKDKKKKERSEDDTNNVYNDNNDNNYNNTKTNNVCIDTDIPVNIDNDNNVTEEDKNNNEKLNITNLNINNNQYIIEEVEIKLNKNGDAINSNYDFEENDLIKKFMFKLIDRNLANDDNDNSNDNKNIKDNINDAVSNKISIDVITLSNDKYRITVIEDNNNFNDDNENSNELIRIIKFDSLVGFKEKIAKKKSDIDGISDEKLNENNDNMINKKSINDNDDDQDSNDKDKEISKNTNFKNSNESNDEEKDIYKDNKKTDENDNDDNKILNNKDNNDINQNNSEDNKNLLNKKTNIDEKEDSHLNNINKSNDNITVAENNEDNKNNNEKTNTSKIINDINNKNNNNKNLIENENKDIIEKDNLENCTNNLNSTEDKYNKNDKNSVIKKISDKSLNSEINNKEKQKEDDNEDTERNLNKNKDINKGDSYSNIEENDTGDKKNKEIDNNNNNNNNTENKLLNESEANEKNKQDNNNNDDNDNGIDKQKYISINNTLYDINTKTIIDTDYKITNDNWKDGTDNHSNKLIKQIKFTISDKNIPEIMNQGDGCDIEYDDLISIKDNKYKVVIKNINDVNVLDNEDENNGKENKLIRTLIYQSLEEYNKINIENYRLKKNSNSISQDNDITDKTDENDKKDTIINMGEEKNVKTKESNDSIDKKKDTNKDDNDNKDKVNADDKDQIINNKDNNITKNDFKDNADNKKSNKDEGVIQKEKEDKKSILNNIENNEINDNSENNKNKKDNNTNDNDNRKQLGNKEYDNDNKKDPEIKDNVINTNFNNEKKNDDINNTNAYDLITKENIENDNKDNKEDTDNTKKISDYKNDDEKLSHSITNDANKTTENDNQAARILDNSVKEKEIDKDKVKDKVDQINENDELLKREETLDNNNYQNTNNNDNKDSDDDKAIKKTIGDITDKENKENRDDNVISNDDKNVKENKGIDNLIKNIDDNVSENDNKDEILKKTLNNNYNYDENENDNDVVIKEQEDKRKKDEDNKDNIDNIKERGDLNRKLDNKTYENNNDDMLVNDFKEHNKNKIDDNKDNKVDRHENAYQDSKIEDKENLEDEVKNKDKENKDNRDNVVDDEANINNKDSNELLNKNETDIDNNDNKDNKDNNNSKADENDNSKNKDNTNTMTKDEIKLKSDFISDINNDLNDKSVNNKEKDNIEDENKGNDKNLIDNNEINKIINKDNDDNNDNNNNNDNKTNKNKITREVANDDNDANDNNHKTNISNISNIGNIHNTIDKNNTEDKNKEDKIEDKHLTQNEKEVIEKKDNNTEDKIQVLNTKNKDINQDNKHNKDEDENENEDNNNSINNENNDQSIKQLNQKLILNILPDSNINNTHDDDNDNSNSEKKKNKKKEEKENKKKNSYLKKKLKRIEELENKYYGNDEDILKNIISDIDKRNHFNSYIYYIRPLLLLTLFKNNINIKYNTSEAEGCFKKLNNNKLRRLSYVKIWDYLNPRNEDRVNIRYKIFSAESNSSITKTNDDLNRSLFKEFSSLMIKYNNHENDNSSKDNYTKLYLINVFKSITKIAGYYGKDNKLLSYYKNNSNKTANAHSNSNNDGKIKNEVTEKPKQTLFSYFSTQKLSLAFEITNHILTKITEDCKNNNSHNSSFNKEILLRFSFNLSYQIKYFSYMIKYKKALMLRELKHTKINKENLETIENSTSLDTPSALNTFKFLTTLINRRTYIKKSITPGVYTINNNENHKKLIQILKDKKKKHINKFKFDYKAHQHKLELINISNTYEESMINASLSMNNTNNNITNILNISSNTNNAIVNDNVNNKTIGTHIDENKEINYFKILKNALCVQILLEKELRNTDIKEEESTIIDNKDNNENKTDNKDNTKAKINKKDNKKDNKGHFIKKKLKKVIEIENKQQFLDKISLQLLGTKNNTNNTNSNVNDNTNNDNRIVIILSENELKDSKEVDHHRIFKLNKKIKQIIKIKIIDDENRNKLENEINNDNLKTNALGNFFKTSLLDYQLSSRDKLKNLNMIGKFDSSIKDLYSCSKNTYDYLEVEDGISNKINDVEVLKLNKNSLGELVNNKYSINNAAKNISNNVSDNTDTTDFRNSNVNEYITDMNKKAIDTHLTVDKKDFSVNFIDNKSNDPKEMNKVKTMIINSNSNNSVSSEELIKAVSDNSLYNNKTNKNKISLNSLNSKTNDIDFSALFDKSFTLIPESLVQLKESIESFKKGDKEYKLNTDSINKLEKMILDLVSEKRVAMKKIILDQYKNNSKMSNDLENMDLESIYHFNTYSNDIVDLTFNINSQNNNATSNDINQLSASHREIIKDFLNSNNKIKSLFKDYKKELITRKDANEINSKLNEIISLSKMISNSTNELARLQSTGKEEEKKFFNCINSSIKSKIRELQNQLENDSNSKIKRVLYNQLLNYYDFFNSIDQILKKAKNLFDDTSNSFYSNRNLGAMSRLKLSENKAIDRLKNKKEIKELNKLIKEENTYFKETSFKEYSSLFEYLHSQFEETINIKKEEIELFKKNQIMKLENIELVLEQEMKMKDNERKIELINNYQK